jgi:hypothetical protein
MTSAHWTFLLLLIPIIGGGVVWLRFKEIVLWEWALSVACALLTIICVFAVSECSTCRDTEIVSGSVTQVCYTPEWHAEWTELETYTTTDSKGKTQTHTRLVTRTQHYSEEWYAQTTIGRVSISREYWQKVSSRYGIQKSLGHRPNYDWGDLFDYYSDVQNKNESLPEYPVHLSSSWKNPLLETDSIKLGQKITDDEAQKLKLPNYPAVTSPWVSNRIIGETDIPVWFWDSMNASLGPRYKINLILVNMSGQSISDAVKLKDYWKNGKKNDLVLCYGSDWSYVFGWSETELVKKSLETLLLERPVDKTIIPKISQIIQSEFKPYPWKKEEEISRPVGSGTVIFAFLFMIAVQIGLFFAFRHNEFSK